MSLDPIKMLMEDHNRSERLFKQLAQRGGHEAIHEQALAICDLLKVHAALEEELVYPVVGAKLGAEIEKHAESEHAEARKLMEQIEGLDPGDQFPIKETVDRLRTAVEAHVKEEEDTIFPKLSAELSDDELVEMGQGMYQRRQELLREHPMAIVAASETEGMAAQPHI